MQYTYNIINPACTGFCQSCGKPLKRFRHCAKCARAEAAKTARQCPDCLTVTSDYARPNSLRCEGCRHRIRRRRRYAQPARACTTCGGVCETVNMLLTKDMCLDCAAIVQQNKPRKPATSNRVQTLYKRRRRQSDPLFRIRSNIGSSIANQIRRRGNFKNRHTEEILCCSMDQLYEHLESQFTEGMSWDNYGDWHIDHIIPVSVGKSVEEIYELNHYKNLQPLWAAENQRKSNSI